MRSQVLPYSAAWHLTKVKTMRQVSAHATTIFFVGEWEGGGGGGGVYFDQ